MKSGGVDVDERSSREMEGSCLASLVPNDESGIIGAVLWNDGYLGLFQ
jgi:hypothetical protein